VRNVLVCALLLAAPFSAAAQNANDVFNNDVLHDVQLRVNARDWDTLKRNFQLDTYYPANLTWAGTTVRDVAIRSRGFGSRNGVKPGLEIEFDRYRDGQRFAGMRSMILDNHWQDPSMMRERISMLFYQRLGWPAPREAHARLWVNDEYVGLYSMVEDVNEEFLAHHFGVGADAIAERGYLYEYRWTHEYNFTYPGAQLEKYEEIFEAKIKDHKSMAELFGPIEDMIRTVNEAAGDFTTRVGEFLNLRDLMTFLAIGNFLSDSDGFLGDFGVNNLYMARLGEQRFERIIPWDKDNAMVLDPANPSRAIDFPILFRFEQNVLAKKAIADAGLRDAYFSDLIRASDSASGWMEGEINRQFDRIRDAAFADPSKPYSNDEIVAAIEHLRRFARQRPGSVRAQVAQSR
jgi:spore coat protein CotH